MGLPAHHAAVAAFVLALSAANHPARAAEAPVPVVVGREAPGADFRRATRALTACLDAEAHRAAGEGLPALAFADRAWRVCAGPIGGVLARPGGSPARRRGLIRTAITDAVLAYEARVAFGPRHGDRVPP
jgi:hypothetical protein